MNRPSHPLQMTDQQKIDMRREKMRKSLIPILSSNSVLGKILRGCIKLYDVRLISEILGERFIFKNLQSEGFLEHYKGKRILEIGPKHGRDSLLLAGLEPDELVLLDLPEKDSMIQEWLPLVMKETRTNYLQGNILYLNPEEYEKLGKFDLIWCTGVLYHNAEQLRLIKRLFDLCKIDGLVVLEGEIAHRRALKKLNVVEIHWPDPFKKVPTITHLPSPLAVKSWMEMVGFQDVQIQKILSKYHSRSRAVVTGKKTDHSQTYMSYNDPRYTVGDAT